jgi:peptidoglycan/LPS O-acetylase OafA/YrhL
MLQYLPFKWFAGYSPLSHVDIEKLEDSDTPFLHQILAHIQAFLLFLLPTFIQNWVQKKPSLRKLHKTSWLDGLRGVACFIVFMFHVILAYNPWLLSGYGATEYNTFIQLPFIRLTYAGTAMVHLFFIISGYVLTARHVQTIRNGQFEKLSDNIFSSIFRRPIRLFLPSVVGLVILSISRWIDRDPNWLKSLWFRLFLLGYIWRPSHFEGELQHLWTIPIELTGSFIVFFLLLGISRAKTWIRITSTFVLITWSGYSGQWGPMEFLGGLFIAEMEAVFQDYKNKSTGSFSKMINTESLLFKIVHHVFWISALIFSLFILCWPKNGADTAPFYKDLLLYTPGMYNGGDYFYPQSFWFGIFAGIIVWSMFRVPILQKPFTLGPIQYLGEISYAFYVMHTLLPNRLQKSIIELSYWIINYSKTPLVLFVAVVIQIIIFSFILIFIADLFMRLIDLPSVRLARWLEQYSRKKQD